MIVNARQNSVEAILLSLQYHNYSFYLTGSRFFGGHIPFNSDCDLFVQGSREVMDFLRSLGFYLVDTAYDKDDQTVNVMRYHKQGNPTVDVQLVKNVDVKERAQKAIQEKYLQQYLKMDKMSRRDLWNVLYYVYYKH